MPKTLKRKRVKQVPLHGQVFIQATFNNTIISVTDSQGNLLLWTSAGAEGFAGARKATPFAAQIATKSVLEKAKNLGMKSTEVYITGIGSGREAAIRSFQGVLDVTTIKDITPIPHNGCRPKKPRRV